MGGNDVQKLCYWTHSICQVSGLYCGTYLYFYSYTDLYFLLLHFILLGLLLKWHLRGFIDYIASLHAAISTSQAWLQYMSCMADVARWNNVQERKTGMGRNGVKRQKQLRLYSCSQKIALDNALSQIHLNFIYCVLSVFCLLVISDTSSCQHIVFYFMWSWKGSK